MRTAVWNLNIKSLSGSHRNTYLSYTLDACAVAIGLAQATIPPNTTCALGPRTSSGPLSSLTPTLQWLESMSGHSPLTGGGGGGGAGEPRARGWVPNPVFLSRTGRPSAQCLDQPPPFLSLPLPNGIFSPDDEHTSMPPCLCLGGWR